MMMLMMLMIYCLVLLVDFVGQTLEDLGFADILDRGFLDLIKKRLDVIPHVVGTGAGAVTTDWFTLGIDQELLEIPVDVVHLDGSPVETLSGSNDTAGTRAQILEETI